MSEGAATTRVDALTDGVVAIVITLLVLDLRLPETIPDMGDAELVATLGAMGPQFLSYGISFFVVGAFWLNHLGLARRIRAPSGALLWLTLCFLATLTLVPFTTSLMARSAAAAGTAIYALDMAAASFFLGMIGTLADSDRPTRGAPPPSGLRAFLTHFGAATIFLASAPLAFVSTGLAQACWLLLLYPFGHLLRRRRQGAEPAPPAS